MTLIDKLKERIEVHAAYSRFFNSEDGKTILRHLMKTCYVTSSTFVAGDPHQSAMNEGSRRTVLSIMNFASKDHKLLVKQIEEEISNNVS
ncbi:hypothetical protein [Caudoviricetes sp.]|nr:hypothetical protein [Caudoviricetes sp.]